MKCSVNNKEISIKKRFFHTGLLKYGPAPLAHDGRVVDTPEVAHLKAAHAAAHAHAHVNAAHGALAPLGHHGGLAPLAYAAAPLAHGAGYAAGYGKWTGPAVRSDFFYSIENLLYLGNTIQ